jgi:hypothetical protein
MRYQIPDDSMALIELTAIAISGGISYAEALDFLMEAYRLGSVDQRASKVTQRVSTLLTVEAIKRNALHGQ